MSRLYSLWVLSLAVLSANCGSEEPPAEAETAASTQTSPGETAPGTMTEASSAVSRWVPVHPAEDASMLSSPCVVRAQAHASGEVSTPFRAQVKTVHVQVGDILKKGAPVVDVSAPEVVAAAASYLGFINRLNVHQERLRALESLQKEGMVRSSSVFEQKALVAELSASLRSAAAVLRMAQVNPARAKRIAQQNRLTLVAPVDGVVATVNGHPGEVLDGSMSFARIIGSASARIEVSSPATLTIGTSLVMRAPDGTLYPLEPTPVATAVAADSGMYRTWFALTDSSVQLGDGLRCTIESTFADDVWQAPARAVATTSKGSVVWRRRGGTIEQIVVDVLQMSGASVLLRGPLEVGDDISADGSATQRQSKGQP